MSTWIYLQAFVDLFLGIGFVLLLVAWRRGRAGQAWHGELATLVDTLGELLVEVERLTAVGPTGAAAPGAIPEPAFTFADATPARPARTEVPPAPAGAIRPAAAPAAAPDNTSLLDNVLAYAGEGLAAEDIARRVGRPVGEISLMLGLRGRQPVGVGG